MQAEVFKHRLDENHVESSQENGGLNAQESDFPWCAVFFHCVRREHVADCLVISFLFQKPWTFTVSQSKARQHFGHFSSPCLAQCFLRKQSFTKLCSYFFGKELQEKAGIRFLLPISSWFFTFVFPVLYVFEEKYWVACHEQHLWQILLPPSSLKGRKIFGIYRQKDENELTLCFESCQWQIILPASEEQKLIPWSYFWPSFLAIDEPALRWQQLGSNLVRSTFVWAPPIHGACVKRKI